MRTAILIGIALMSLSSWADSFRGTPSVVRDYQGRTEVFFRDLKDQYVIPNDSGHNEKMQAFVKATDSRQQVSFEADPHSRQITKVGGVLAPGSVVDKPEVAPEEPTVYTRRYEAPALTKPTSGTSFKGGTGAQ